VEAMKQVCTVEELGEFWTLSADGYAGFEKLYRRGDIKEVACLAHIRRKFFDIHATNGSGIAKEALERIAALYQIEASIRGKPPDVRRSVRQEHAAPLIDELEAWLHAQLMQISGKSALAGAIRYGLTRLKRLRHQSTPHESILRVCHRSELVQRFLR
jgi:transposase